MKKILFVLFAISSFQNYAQSNPFFKRTPLEGGLTLSSNGCMSAVGLDIHQYWGLGKKQRKMNIGLGIRLTSSFGSSNLNYITAPANLTSGKTGPGVFFSDQVVENIDTVFLNNTQVNAFNLFLALHYKAYKKWAVEFNIDLIGASFGGNKTATINYGDGIYGTKTTTAKPTSPNVLLISDNDKGSLNSEFMISYQLKDNIKLKAGPVFLFNEYTVENPVSYTNTKSTLINTDRYRKKAFMFGIGFNYVFNKKN
ncbi:MAG: hypothetical protein R2831_08090 [Chitinophagaceae bacterium]